jgi:hypothetical protein
LNGHSGIEFHFAAVGAFEQSPQPLAHSVHSEAEQEGLFSHGQF